MKGLYSLLRKDFRLMVSGKFFLMSMGFLILYTLYVNFGYIRFMDSQLYNVYLYDPAGTQKTASPLIQHVSTREELDRALLQDTNGIGIDAVAGEPKLYFMREQKRPTAIEPTMLFLFYSRWSRTQPALSALIHRSKKHGKRLPVNCFFLRFQQLDFWGWQQFYLRKRVWALFASMRFFPFGKICFCCLSWRFSY